MPRALPAALAVLTLGLSTSPALATEQIEERLVVGGRVYRMPVTPLEPFLRQRGENPFRQWITATNLWRGYVGTWLLEDDRLYLSSLLRYVYEHETDKPSRRIAKDLPLSLVFGEQPGPIPATWWSGALAVPRGRVLRAGWRSRDCLHEQTLYLHVTKGRVVAKRLVDNRKEGRGLSPEDIQWGMQAPRRIPSTGTWHDARTIRSAAFRRAVPTGTTFRTRGRIFASQHVKPVLWVPRTPATDPVRFQLRDLPDREPFWQDVHAEVTASWEEAGDEFVLRVAEVRDLKPGESMHHAEFVVPELPRSEWPPADEELDPNIAPVLRDRTYVEGSFGVRVSLRGKIVAGPPASIHGVDVAGDEVPAGCLATAAGVLEKWIVSQKLLDADPEVAQLFGARGPGTYYRLLHPVSGQLARARRAVDK